MAEGSCVLNFGRYSLVDVSKRMAPQVGLESSVKRIFNNMQVGG
jgi:hypothetical protein